MDMQFAHFSGIFCPEDVSIIYVGINTNHKPMKRSMFLQNSQYPGQFPDRIQRIAGVCFVPLLAWTMGGQELPADRVSVPLRDSSNSRRSTAVFIFGKAN